MYAKMNASLAEDIEHKWEKKNLSLCIWMHRIYMEIIALIYCEVLFLTL